MFKANSGLKQTEIKFMFLAARLADTPAANPLKSIFSPKGSTGLREPPACQQQPGVARLRNHLVCADEPSPLDMLPRGRTINDATVRVCERRCNLYLQLLRPQVVVGIQVLQPLSARHIQQTIARLATPTVGARFPADTTVELSNNVETAISRSIINDNDLFLLPCLCQGAFDCLSDPALCIVAGYEN